MKKDQWPVTEKSGPRPAGKPDRCFYCHEPIGKEHKEKCVIRNRTVVVEARIQYVIEVPEFWSDEDIKSHRNESTWCADNGLDEIASLSERQDKWREKHIDGVPHCMCNQMSYVYVREATVEDERMNGVYIGKNEG